MSKIKVVKQRDMQDCGACCLSWAVNFYGGYVPLEKIREDTQTSINGTTAYHLVNALQNYGFEAIGVKVSNIHNKNIYFPAIAHLVLKNGLNHFVVIYKVTKGEVFLMDPAKGKVKLQLSDFEQIWDNILILFTPINDIINFEKELSIFTIINKIIFQNKNLFIKICIMNIFFMLLTILSNFYLQICISSFQNGSDHTFVKFIIFIFFIILLFKVITNYIKTYYLNYFNKNIDTQLFTEFLTHLFHLPLKYIQNRSTGEIVTRVDELNEIKTLFSEILSNIILNAILILGTIFTLYWINNKLFFILCLIIIIYSFIGLMFSKLIYRKITKVIQTTTEFNSTLIENVDMNNSIKYLNLIVPFLYRLENKLIIMLKNNFNFSQIINFINFLKTSIYEIGMFIINTIGIYFIYENKMDVLNLVTFNSIMIYLLNPTKDLIDMIPKINYLKASFNKISEFLALEVENCNQGYTKLYKPTITIKNLSYSYNQYSNVIKNINTQIAYGEKVLLNGPSGSGKSTICKLLYRSLTNYSGKIEFNRINEQDFNLNSIRENVLYVGQNEKLFTGTIKENIICFRNISELEFKKIVKICCVDQIIKNRPNRYETIINASLNNLSGGEKQRIVLARALLKKAQIIILDEALSEVNINMEQKILNNIFKYFPKQTLIYVTHKNVEKQFHKIIHLPTIC